MECSSVQSLTSFLIRRWLHSCHCSVTRNHEGLLFFFKNYRNSEWFSIIELPFWQVLIVGGGNGGIAREVAKHPLVQNIDIVEIDQRLVELSKKYLPFMAKGFLDLRVNLHIADGFKFMEERSNTYDIIITNSSNPTGE